MDINYANTHTDNWLRVPTLSCCFRDVLYCVHLCGKSLASDRKILICSFFWCLNMTTRGWQDSTACPVEKKKKKKIKADVLRRLGRVVTTEQRGRLILKCDREEGRNHIVRHPLRLILQYMLQHTAVTGNRTDATNALYLWYCTTTQRTWTWRWDRLSWKQMTAMVGEKGDNITGGGWEEWKSSERVQIKKKKQKREEVKRSNARKKRPEEARKRQNGGWKKTEDSGQLEETFGGLGEQLHIELSWERLQGTKTGGKRKERGDREEKRREGEDG